MNSNLVPTIHMNDGRQAYNFVPDLNDGQELAVVTKDVLEYLVRLLPRVNIGEIIHTFSEKAGDVKTIEQWCNLLKSELGFHSSVNMLQQHLLERKPEPARV